MNKDGKQEQLSFMDDYCKNAYVFLNKDDEQKFTLKKNAVLFKLYKKALTNAFKKVPVAQEVPGFNEFLNWDTSMKTEQTTSTKPEQQTSRSQSPETRRSKSIRPSASKMKKLITSFEVDSKEKQFENF